MSAARKGATAAIGARIAPSRLERLAALRSIISSPAIGLSQAEMLNRLDEACSQQAKMANAGWLSANTVGSANASAAACCPTADEFEDMKYERPHKLDVAEQKSCDEVTSKIGADGAKVFNNVEAHADADADADAPSTEWLAHKAPSQHL